MEPSGWGGRLVKCALLAVALAGSCDRAVAQIFDFTAVPLPGDIYTTAHFRVYLPPTAPTIRGAYFYVNPYNGDSRAIVDNPAFRSLCEDTEFALLGAQLDNVDMNSGIGDAVLRALEAFADSSGRPEMVYTTIFFDGHSWGGQFSYHFTLWKPERTIGFVTQKGGYHSTAPAGDAIDVPGYMFIGELDLPYRIKNLTGIFEAHRPQGALWILAIQPGAGHGRIQDRDLLDTYFRAVITRRIPSVIAPYEPVVLRQIDERVGWLGNRTTSAIAAHACYDEDPGQACWFPSRRVAEQWQAFVSDSTVTDTIACDPQVAPEADRGSAAFYLAPGVPNPGGRRIALSYHVDQAGNVELAVYSAGGRLVRRLDHGRRSPGDYTVRWDRRDAAGNLVPAGVYHCRLRVGGGRTATRKMVLANAP